jgi:tetratricopeptide (TPR) repeat protein
MHRLHGWSAGLIVVLLLQAYGCASHYNRLEASLNASEMTSSVELRDIPFFPQEEYQCGPAALATVLVASGSSVTPGELTGKVYLPQREGSLQLELIAAVRRYGRLPYVINGELSALLMELDAGRPVLVLQNLGLASYPIWHYAVVIGFDATSDEIILRSGDRRRLAMRTWKFMRSWELAENWAMVVLRPGEMPVAPDETRYVHAIAALESAAQPEAAGIFYDAALSRWPDNVLALFGTGNIHYTQGDTEAAEATYRRLLVLHPEHVAARNNLAQVLSERGCIKAAIAELDSGLAAMGRDDPMRQLLLESRSEILSSSVSTNATGAPCP